jgi:hypothetical protein
MFKIVSSNRQALERELTKTLFGPSGSARYRELMARLEPCGTLRLVVDNRPAVEPSISPGDLSPIPR